MLHEYVKLSSLRDNSDHLPSVYADIFLAIMTNVQHDGIAVFSSIRQFSYKGNLKSLLNHNTLGIKIVIKININSN